jgi:hypothetical protein
MPDDLTNSQIALLCAIEEHDPANSTDDQKRDLERLVLVGYVQPAGSAFELTAKGVAFLGELGAGLNEA